MADPFQPALTLLKQAMVPVFEPCVAAIGPDVAFLQAVHHAGVGEIRGLAAYCTTVFSASAPETLIPGALA